MKKLVLLFVFSLLAIAPATAQEKLPTADQILDKYVQAIGGKAAHEKLTTRVAKGTFEIPAMGAGGALEIYAKAPNKAYLMITIEGFGVVQQGYTGTMGWEDNPQTGMRELSGAEASAAKLDSVFHRDVKLKELYPKMEVKGKEKVGASDTYVVVGTPTEGPATTFYFDAQSGLLLRADTVRETQQGTMAVREYFEDYKEMDGIKAPSTIKQESDAISFVLRLTEIKHNVPIEDTKFNKPAK